MVTTPCMVHVDVPMIQITVMSFVRVPHRSQSLSSLNGSRAKKKKRRPQAAWDDSVTDLNQHKATFEEIEHRRSVHRSKNLDAVRQQKLEKQIAKARAKNEQSHNTSDYRGTRLLREILYDESQLQDALSHSDRVMAVVADLFGDDPKRHTAFPNVTLAPGQKPGQRHQGPISEAPETPSRMTLLSESVMNSQALNDMEGNGSSESDLEEDKENVPVSFHSNLNFDRFQDFIKKQQTKQASHPYDSTHASLLQNTGNSRLHQDYGKKQTNETHQESLDSSQADGDSAPPTNAINDTVKVKKKTRSRIGKEKQQVAEEQKVEDSLNLSTVLRGLAQQMTDYEVATGRQPQTADHGGTSLSHNAPGVSGYTSLLVQTIAKLIGYLKETESRMGEEKQMREQMQYQVAEQRILIDAITADLLATQDLQLQNQQEFNQYMAHTQVQLKSIQEMLSSKLGLQTTSAVKSVPQPSKEQSIPHSMSSQQTLMQSVGPRQWGPPHQHHQPGQPHSLQAHQLVTRPEVSQEGVRQSMQSQPHQPMSSQAHQPMTSQPHQPMSSQPHQPMSSQPHQSMPLQSHQSMLSQPHQPMSSQPHQLMSSQPHQLHPMEPQPSQRLISQNGMPHQGAHQTISSQPHHLNSPRPLASHQSAPPPGILHQRIQGHHLNASQERQSHQHGYHQQATDVASDKQVDGIRTPLAAVNVSQMTTSNITSLVDEFSNALQQATSRTGTSSKADPSTASTTLNTGETLAHKSVALTRLSQDQHITDHFPGPPTSQFTSSFLEDKRHLGARDTNIPFQPAVLLSPPRQRDRSSVVRPKVASVGAYPLSSSDGTAVGTIHSIKSGAQTYTVPSSFSQSLYSNKQSTAVPIPRQLQMSSFTAENTSLPSSAQADADLGARIAQLTKEHEVAQSRLNQLKSASGGGVGSQGKEPARSARTTDAKSKFVNGSALPVSPPISPIPFDHHLPVKPMSKGPSHVAKEGKTIHVSLPRPDDLEISATSTPSPKTFEGRTRARHSNLHVSESSQPWKTPDKHGDSQEEQFFALTAHMST
ncbi:uncharacterized protein [Amphiura filiformis]|uniref:uncharacterized protein n=1 Tax=Amphiura filiformis TaxID=82378 RepID=UPI003B218782